MQQPSPQIAQPAQTPPTIAQAQGQATAPAAGAGNSARAAEAGLSGAAGDPGVVIARLPELRADPAGAPIRLLLTDPARGGARGQRARFAAGVEAWARQEEAGIERAWAAEDPEMAAIFGDLPSEAEARAIEAGAKEAIRRLSPEGIARDVGIRALIAAAAQQDAGLWAGLEIDAPGSQQAYAKAGGAAEVNGAATGATTEAGDEAATGEAAATGAEQRGVSSAGLPATKQEALQRQARGRQRVAKLIAGAMAVSPGGDPQARATLLRNSAEWITTGEADLYALSPAHAGAQAKPGQIAYFDARLAWDQPGATYGDSGDGLLYKARGVLGTQEGRAVYLLDPAGQPEADLAETLIHEVLHDSDQHDGANVRQIAGERTPDADGINAYINLYLSEFNAFWISAEGEDHLGSPDKPASNQYPVQITSREADGSTRVRTAPTHFQNERQQGVFWRIAGGYSGTVYDASAGPRPAFSGYSYLPWYYVTSPAFQWKVDQTDRPTTPNAASSVRVQALSEAILASDRAAFDAAWAALTPAERTLAWRSETLSDYTEVAPVTRAKIEMRQILDAKLDPGGAAQATTVTVQPGDTLRTIAARLLGSPERSGEIYALNRDRLTSPDHIEAGQKLRLPLRG